MIVAIDFDGTLCESRYPLIGKPKMNVIEKAKQLKAQGDTLILWTCRKNAFLKAAVRWCEKYGLTFDYINENDSGLVKMFTNDSRKVFADLYIDDKAMNVEDFA